MTEHQSDPDPEFHVPAFWQGRLFKFGLIGTMLWLGVGAAVLLFASENGALKPNEWGDVFAGLFAPVAFLWLVLGFIQQGTELQLSTRTLQLQVRELKNFVEQQQALVAVTREQVEVALEEQHRLRAAEEAQKSPRLLVRYNTRTTVQGTGTSTYEFEIVNDGATATQVSVAFPPPYDQGGTHIAIMAKGDRRLFRANLPEQYPAQGVLLTVNYLDSDFKSKTLAFQTVAAPSGRSGQRIDVSLVPS